MKLLASVLLAALVLTSFTFLITKQINLVNAQSLAPISAPLTHPLINEFSSAGTSEWVELFNPTSKTISLMGWRLTDNGGSGRSFPFNAQLLLPNNFLVIDFNLGLNDGGDTVKLIDQNNNLIDGVPFGSEVNAIIGAPISGKSAYRVPDGANNWEISSFITKGLPNHTPVPTPTPIPTLTPQPTATSIPTLAPQPTVVPTPTPQPSLTPVPSTIPVPTVTPTPVPQLTPTPKPFVTSITANSSSADLGNSDSLSPAPICGDQMPASAPNLLSAVAVGPNQVRLTWSAADGQVTYYLVAFGTKPGSLEFGNPNVGDAKTRTYLVDHLSSGQSYYFKVRAGNGCMPGEFSNELSVSPSGVILTKEPTGFQKGVLGVSTIKNQQPEITKSPVIPNLVEWSNPEEKSLNQQSILGGIWEKIFNFLTQLFK